MNEDDGAHVHAARGLLGDQHGGVVRKLAGGHDLLQIAARQRPDRGVDGGDLDVETIDQAAGPGTHGLRLQQALDREGRRAVEAHREVVRRARSRGSRGAGAILGDVAQARAAMRRHRCPGDIPTLDEHGALRHWGQPHEGFDEFRLPVAGDTGDPDDFAAAHLERHVIDDPPPALFDAQAPGLEFHVAGFAGLLWDLQGDVLAGHGTHDGVRSGLGRDQPLGHATIAQDGNAIADRHDFVQFVGHEQNGAAVRRQALHDAEQRRDFRRRQHGGRLVEDQDLRVAIQDLQDLEPLPYPHGQVRHARPGIDRQSVAEREFLDLSTRPGAIDEEAAPRLAAVDDVFPHAQGLEQFEGLMDHADAFRDGVERRLQQQRAALEAHVALVG